MEVSIFMSSLASFLALLASLYIMKLAYSLWLKPKIVEKQLKQQGIGGTSYSFPYGDKQVSKKLTIEAWSVPMTLNHEIVPRVNPFLYQIVQRYGQIKLSISVFIFCFFQSFSTQFLQHLRWCFAWILTFLHLRIYLVSHTRESDKVLCTCLVGHVAGGIELFRKP